MIAGDEANGLRQDQVQGKIKCKGSGQECPLYTGSFFYWLGVYFLGGFAFG
jgi:hypothetical protein